MKNHSIDIGELEIALMEFKILVTLLCAWADSKDDIGEAIYLGELFENSIRKIDEIFYAE